MDFYKKFHLVTLENFGWLHFAAVISAEKKSKQFFFC